jgi:hypothetical protein
MTLVFGRVRAALWLTIAVGSLVGLPSNASAQSCTQTLSPGANVASAASSAAAGSTICLNSGSYGTVALGAFTKSPRVTIRSASGQGANMRLTFSGTNGITASSLTVTGANFSGSNTRNITIENSTFTGHVVFNGLANSNVLLDRNTHNNIQGGGQFSAPARIHLSYSGSTHSGVTVQNSMMDGGSADGVQTGVGVNIIANVFRNIREGSCGDCHTDAIQLLGAPDTLIRGNFFQSVATAIVAFDGVTRATIEHNVVDTGGRPWGIELYADRDSIIRHNTLVYRASCDYNQPCGMISLDRKTANAAGSGTRIIDNIATSIATNNGSTYAERHHNLVRSGAVSGDISGSPTYVGGSAPGSLEGYALASNSAGKRAASNPSGSDVGADVAGSDAGGETPPQGAPAPPTNVRIIQ